VDRAIKSDARPIPFVVARLALVRAQLLAARGDLHGARARVESVLVQTGDQGAGAALLAMEALLTASRIAAAEGRLGEAESYARDALRRSELRARDPAQSADVGEAALVLAQIGLRLDKHSEAQALASRAAISLRNSLGANHSLTRAALALLHNPDR
jgi:hypothetical protein